jgi:competence protein ComEC
MLHVWFLDMGHSNAVLAQTPGGAHILVDGGRFPSRLLTAIGDRLPFNDRELELVLLTQPDENDFAALEAVLRRYRVGAFLTNGQPNDGEAYSALNAALAGTNLVTAQAGYAVELSDGARLEILAPAVPPLLGDSLDDGTLVARLTYGEVSFLLTGDVSTGGQSALLKNGAWPLATVMQLPQHGAARSLSEAFLAAVQPQAVALQSDPANRFGDPDPDTLARLGETPLFRTDQQGTLHFWTDGMRLWMVGERRIS